MASAATVHEPAHDTATSTLERYAALIRCATLAASSHNTQPWKFSIEADGMTVHPDFSRRCSVVDPDDHHLFVSLGCAAENLLVAAQAAGLQGCLALDPAHDVGNIRITFEQTAPQRSSLFDAIEHRQCTRSEYDGRAVPVADLKALELSGSSDRGQVLILTDKAAIEAIGEYVAAGNATQLTDEQFVAELMSWVRFNRAEAARLGDGLFGGSVGMPQVPRWLGKTIMSLAVSPEKQTDKDLKQIRSSAGVAVFVSNANDKRHWIDAGRRYERVALQATALGVRNAFINQPLEVTPLRWQLASYLGLGDRRPDLMIRFGYGPDMPPSYRRPLHDVLL
jgi:hypothetical protein